jgi:uncharacterized protein YaeQ
MDRGVYETLDLRVARHPSETAEYMVIRVLAYCLEYQDGIEMTDGVSSGDEPGGAGARSHGRVTAWIEVGMPDAARPAPRQQAGRARGGLYAPRHPPVARAIWQARRFTAASEIPIRAFDRTLVEQVAALLDRRTSMSISVTHGEVYVSVGEHSITLPINEHRLSG